MTELKKEEMRAIKDNNTDYFEDLAFSEEKKTKLLEYAISEGKIIMTKVLMDEGVQVKNSWCYHTLMGKKRKPDILAYLEEKGVDLTQGSHILYFKAACGGNLGFSQYLAPKLALAKQDTLYLILINVHNQHKKNDKILYELLTQVMKHSDSETVNKFLDNIKDDVHEHRKWVLNEFLKNEMLLEKEEKQKPKIKI